MSQEDIYLLHGYVGSPLIVDIGANAACLKFAYRQCLYEKEEISIAEAGTLMVAPALARFIISIVFKQSESGAIVAFIMR